MGDCHALGAFSVSKTRVGWACHIRQKKIFKLENKGDGDFFQIFFRILKGVYGVRKWRNFENNEGWRRGILGRVSHFFIDVTWGEERGWRKGKGRI